MKTLYLECQMGAAGDMLLAALWELLPDQPGFLQTLSGLSLHGVTYTPEQAVRCGVTGTHMKVTIHGEEEGQEPHDHDHHHSTLGDIYAAIDGLAVSDWVKDQAKAVYRKIAAAESQVHNCPVETIHFHEVGAWDAVADVTGVCLALEQLAPEQIVVSPIHVGGGQVRCAHGILPVPAPATALLLQGAPICGGPVDCELCTPTGAALLTHFAHSYGPMPTMTVEKIGYGMGTKDLERANFLRAFWGETPEQADEILELRCNLDDMTGEALAFAAGELFRAGALDVFTTAIGMKKSRPGTLLTCICRPEDEAAMCTLILRHTTTWGIRKTRCRRVTLPRTISTVETPYGPIRLKTAGGKAKAEYEDVAKAARAHGVSLAQVLDALPRA